MPTQPVRRPGLSTDWRFARKGSQSHAHQAGDVRPQPPGSQPSCRRAPLRCVHPQGPTPQGSAPAPT
eukprot:6247618-Prymnesium_polylepis.1